MEAELCIENIKAEPESFEKAMQELKEIVKILETKQESLDMSVLYFKRGSYLSKWCESYLKNMQEEIVTIMSEDEP